MSMYFHARHQLRVEWTHRASAWHARAAWSDEIRRTFPRNKSFPSRTLRIPFVCEFLRNPYTFLTFSQHFNAYLSCILSTSEKTKLSAKGSMSVLAKDRTRYLLNLRQAISRRTEFLKACAIDFWEEMLADKFISINAEHLCHWCLRLHVRAEWQTTTHLQSYPLRINKTYCRVRESVADMSH